ncbi:glycine receptor subunit alpha-1-like isoform X2 [Gigantopelta aegis]|nr:glycine receptor subunit alpha-1-like isoform X2 [Gigantopelta aegis]
MVINSVGPVNGKDMDYGISMFLRQEWTDPRLVFNDFNKSLVLGSKLLADIWVPDVYFAQSKKEHRHIITTPNVLLRLTPGGSILYSQRLSATIQCQMDLSKFPMDSQKCKLMLESYSFTTDDLVLLWSSKRAATSVLPNAYIPDFLLINTTTGECTTTYATGTFPCLKVELFLEREIGFYITQTYVPSILIVILSWASFWIDHQAVPARISVGLLTVLTITTQSSGARAQLPRVPYIKAIDVWMSVCLVCVFAAYMEYAVVTVLSRRYKKSEKEKQMAIEDAVSVTNIALQDGQNGSPPTAKGTKPSKTSDKNTGRIVDKIARILFPTAFLIFNLIYWFYYLYLAD